MLDLMDYVLGILILKNALWPLIAVNYKINRFVILIFKMLVFGILIMEFVLKLHALNYKINKVVNLLLQTWIQIKLIHVFINIINVYMLHKHYSKLKINVRLILY